MILIKKIANSVEFLLLNLFTVFYVPIRISTKGNNNLCRSYGRFINWQSFKKKSIK